jgi:hypothetical protein
MRIAWNFGGSGGIYSSINRDLWNSHKNNVSKLEGYDIGTLANCTSLIFSEKKYKRLLIWLFDSTCYPIAPINQLTFDIKKSSEFLNSTQ